MVKREYYPLDENRAGLWLQTISEFIRHSDVEPDDLKMSALLVVDMQNFFIDENSHASFPSAREIIPNINKLISVFAASGRPVIFTRYAFAESDDPGIMVQWWRDKVLDNTPEAEINSKMVVPDDAFFVRKTVYDSFHNTELKEIMDDHGVKSVVITGVMTHLCCETSARSAFTNGFSVYFPVDANGTINEELHLSSLKTLSDGFVVPLTTNDLITELNRLNAGGD
jgi:nicotinamidase-related amidase